MEIELVHYGDYVAGWLNSSVQEILEAIPRSGTSTKYALVTSLDSNLKPGILLGKSPEFRSVELQATVVGDGLLLPTKRLLEANARSPFFFGFDEIWFFPDDHIEPKPDSAWLVGPSRIRQIDLDALGTWMERSSCSLALGDGDGLNFIVKGRGLVGVLLGQTLKQPHSVPTPFPIAESA
jgi:hypothetical protein